MKKSLIALSILALSGAAFASNGTITCGDCRNGQNVTGGALANGGIADATATANGGIARQSQEQNQAQSIDNAGNSTVRVNAGGGGATLGDGVGSANLSGSFGGAGGQGSGTATLTGSGNGGGASGNTLTLASGAIGGGNTYRSNDRVWANPIIHGAGAAPIASANMMAVPGICGFRQVLRAKEVVGQRFEQVGSDRQFVQGYTEYTVPDTENALINYNGFLIGHSVTTVVAALGTSSAGSFSLGLFGKNGEGAQGGAAVSAGHQQLVSKIIVQDCIFAAPPQPVIIEEPMPPYQFKKGRE